MFIAIGIITALLQPFAAAAEPPSPRSNGLRSAIPTAAPAEPATIARNAEVLQELPFDDRQDYDDAKKGFIATLPGATIEDDQERVVFTLDGFEFLQQPQAPSTVNPSLWRMAQLNMNNGLFLVKERVYQVRGFDLANRTIIEGDDGVIVSRPPQRGLHRERGFVAEGPTVSRARSTNALKAGDTWDLLGTISCTTPNGFPGTQTWNGTSYGTCAASSCPQGTC